jgi:hypothetical protein
MTNHVGRSVGALVIGGVLIASAVGANWPRSGVAAEHPSTACVSTQRSLEATWHGTGAWRRISPYPVERDASPTDSIGVWLERWHMPDGSVELRRVSAAVTIAAFLSEPACNERLVAHHRTFDSSAMANAFTDDGLRDLLERTRDGVIYVWSPGMPLSVSGLAEARAAADSLGISFTAIVADAHAADLRESFVDTVFRHPLNALDLVYRDATLHYPSIIFYRNGSLIGSAIPGYKRRDTYVALARDAFRAASSSSATTVLPVAATPAPSFWVDHKAQLTQTRSVETVRPVGFFFKPVAMTDLISYTSQNAAYLFDLGARREQRIPGTVDPVPTPDGKFLTRPGLMFYLVPTLASGDTTPLFVDRELPDEYQTISILKQSRDAVRYRVVTGWRMGVRLREYDITFPPGGKPPHIEPLGTPMVPCAGRGFSLPISAKGTREVGVYDKDSRTNRIIEIGEDGHCTDVLDLGFASGKLSFNYDASAIAFATSRIDVDADGFMLQPEEAFYKDALVLYRKTGRIVSLSRNRGLRGMTFPEFLPDGRSIILDQRSRLRPSEFIRVIEIK